MNTDNKKNWKAPELTVYGSVVDITKQTYKQIGGNDGIILVTQHGNVGLGNLGS